MYEDSYFGDEISYSKEDGDQLNDTCANHPEFKAGDCIGVSCLVATIVICITTALAISGNVLNIILLTSGKFLSKPHVYFLTSLALSDLITGVINAFSIYPSIEHDWPFSQTACNSLNYVRETVLEVSVLMILCLTVERYLVICYPIRHRIWLSRRRCKVIIVVCWVSTMAAKFHLLFDALFTTSYNDDVYVCVTKYDKHRNIAFLSPIVMELPVLAIVTLTSIKVMVTLHLANRRRSNMSVTSRTPTGQRRTSTGFILQQNMKTFKMIIVIAAITFVTLIPSFSLRIIYILKGCETVRDRFPWVLEFSFFWLASFGSFSNFFVFSFMDRNFFTCLRLLCSRGIERSGGDKIVSRLRRKRVLKRVDAVGETTMQNLRLTVISGKMIRDT